MKNKQPHGRLISHLARQIESRDDTLERIKQKIDSAVGRRIYSLRVGKVKPVFGRITKAIGINLFSLRGKQKVGGQWKLTMA